MDDWEEVGGNLDEQNQYDVLNFRDEKVLNRLISRLFSTYYSEEAVSAPRKIDEEGFKARVVHLLKTLRRFVCKIDEFAKLEWKDQQDLLEESMFEIFAFWIGGYFADSVTSTWPMPDATATVDLDFQIEDYYKLLGGRLYMRLVTFLKWMKYLHLDMNIAALMIPACIFKRWWKVREERRHMLWMAQLKYFDLLKKYITQKFRTHKPEDHLKFIVCELVILSRWEQTWIDNGLGRIWKRVDDLPKTNQNWWSRRPFAKEN